MGLDALNGNGITKKIYYLIQDKATILSSEPLGRVRRSRILLFVVTQIICFGATMAITQTIGVSNPLVRVPAPERFTHSDAPAAIGFPIVISLLIPLRTIVIPRLPFTEVELALLDGPTASSFVSSSLYLAPIQRCLCLHETMGSVGGTL